MRGAVAESMVCTWALEQGYNVCFPARGLAPPYDMILERFGICRRVQVKRAYWRKRDTYNQLRVKLLDGNADPYDYVDVQAFAIVDTDTPRIWMIPFGCVCDKRSIALSSGKWDKYLVKG